MAIFSDMINIGMKARLDHVIREHERLEVRFNRLVELLASKGLITRDERISLDAEDIERQRQGV